MSRHVRIQPEVDQKQDLAGQKYYHLRKNEGLVSCFMLEHQLYAGDK